MNDTNANRKPISTSDNTECSSAQLNTMYQDSIQCYHSPYQSYNPLLPPPKPKKYKYNRMFHCILYKPIHIALIVKVSYIVVVFKHKPRIKLSSVNNTYNMDRVNIGTYKLYNSYLLFTYIDICMHYI